MGARAGLFTVAALSCFAANSILCRLALGAKAIDPYAFTYVRLASGAITLWLVAQLRRRGEAPPGEAPPGDAAPDDAAPDDAAPDDAAPEEAGGQTRRAGWWDALWLGLYAMPFSIAYTRLGAGTGALILFGAVQLTLIVSGLRAGERPTGREALGFAGAVAGLVYLVSPGLSAPDPVGAVWMAVAGVGWGFYTVAGKRGGDPTRRTARNFSRATALMVPLALLTATELHGSATGVALAVASGAIASGLGYAAWYVAMRHLTALRAGLLQLGVPILAAAGGILFLGEALTLRLVMASVVMLGSLGFALVARTVRAG